MNTDEATGDHVRRVLSKWRKSIDRAIVDGTVPVPVRIFTNSLFVELTFASTEDAQALDSYACLFGWLQFYWV